jgi:hypothetical protein
MAVSVSSSSILLLPFLLLCSLASACDRCVHRSRASFLTSSLTLAGKSVDGINRLYNNCICSVKLRF